MKILIIGASGMLGRVLSKHLPNLHLVYGIGSSTLETTKIKYTKLDLLEKNKIELYLSLNKFDLIINLAAIVNHQYCNTHVDECYALNTLINNRILASVSPKTRYLFVSSDAVFGDSDIERFETSPANPSTIYGKTKLKAEQSIKQLSSNYIILRTTIVGFSPRRTSLTDWIINNVKSNENLSLFDDVYFNPISIFDLSLEIEYLIENFEKNSNQILHVSGSEKVTKYQFGELLVEKLQMPTANISKSSLRDFKLKGNRVYNQFLEVENYQKKTSRPLPNLAQTVNTLILNYNYDFYKI
jgi:dTDP-4-dehydrorhamnose reductase